MRALLIFAFVTLLSIPANAQIDRRDRHDPELVINTGGRTGTCDAILFDPSGANLFAVGDDKVVSAWKCSTTGLDTANMRSIRWPSWRERRGGIKALAISHDGRRIVIGGYGVLVSSIAVIDPFDGDAGKILHMYPDPRKVVQGENYYAVMCAAFSDDGKSIAYGTADGTIWLWQPGSNPRPLDEHQRMTDPTTGAKSSFNRPRLVAFTKKGFVLSVAQSGEMRAIDPTGKREAYIQQLIKLNKQDPTDAPFVIPGGIYRAVLSPDRTRLAIATLGPLVAGFDLRDEPDPPRYVRLDNNHFVRALAFHPDGKQLALAVGHVPPNAVFSIEADDQIKLIANPLTAEWRLAAGPAHSFRADALAFHPKDGRLAIAGGDNHEVTLWDLAKPRTPQSVARGVGRNLWGVRISADGNAVGFQPKRDASSVDPNKRGAGDFLAFSLEKGVPQAAAPQWFEPIASMNGWTIKADPNDRFKWYAVHESRKDKELLIPIDKDRDEWPRCWTFLPTAKDKPPQLIVGHFYGCSVYDVTENEVKRRFACIGHAGEVVSIGPAKDGTWFVTAGTDQTIAAWSSDTVPNNQLFGARMLVEDGQLMVTDVAPRSPAYEMGLVKGDQIVFMAVGRKVLFNHSGVYDKKYGPKTGDPAKCRDYLQNPTPGVFAHLGIHRPGQAKMIEIVTSMPRRPIWRFFPAFDEKDVWRDYLAWLWWKPYYLSSINGDSLTGWSMNQPSMIETPNFYRAILLRDQLENKKLIREVLTTRNLNAALVNSRELHFDTIEPAPVRIEPSSLKVGENGINLRLIVKKRNDNPDLLPERVDLWIGDYLFDFWQPEAKEFVKDIALPLSVFRNGANKIVLKTKNHNGLDNDAEVVVEAERKIGAPRMHSVFIGVNNYDPKKVRTNKGETLHTLNYAKTDAEKLSEKWKEHQGKDGLFLPGSQRTFLDDEVSSKGILAHLEKLALDKTIQPDDLLVLFFAGHGLDLEVPGRIPGRNVNQFVFCCPDFVEKEYTTTGIAGDTLVRTLSRIRCRKLLILDACKSGLAVDSDLAREMAVEGQNFVIMTACGTSQLATEDKDLGHGLFTSAIIEALDPKCVEADTNGDKVLDASELFAYVEKRVAVLVEKTKSRTMTPMCYPSTPDRFAIARRGP